MDITFNCPKCGIAIQASTESSGFTVHCPVCREEFGVEADPPVMPVVKARVVSGPVMPAAVPGPSSHRVRPPLARPETITRSPGPTRPRYQRRTPSAGASNDKMGFIALGLICLLLAGLMFWFVRTGEKRASAKTGPTPEEIARKEQISEEVRILERNLEEQRILEEQKEQRIKSAQQKDREESEFREKVLAQEKKEYEAMLDELAKSVFRGDVRATEAFITAWQYSQIELWAVLSDDDPSNDPRTRDQGVQYFMKLLIGHIERDSYLSQWLKDHNRDPRQFIPELVQGRQKGRASAGNQFDFTKYTSSGTGFFVSSDGWILTNEHVVSDSAEVDLRLRDGRILQAKVVKTDPSTDLALLKAEMAAPSFLAVSKGDLDLQLGRTVFTVGYPDPVIQGLEPKFSDGRISAASGLGDRRDSYQISVPLQHGNSGGALVDFATGWVVGVVNARLEVSSGVSADNVGYAIKGNVVSAFFESVPEARASVLKYPPKPPAKGDERGVIDHVTTSAVLILSPR